MKKKKLAAPDPLDILVAGLLIAVAGVGVTFGAALALLALGLGTMLVGFILASTPETR